jgi:hypothetical protein
MVLVQSVLAWKALAGVSVRRKETMRAPHFLRLAEIDEQRFINACRHGLVHMTWSRITVRFSRDEFRRLDGLLARAAAAPPPSSARDGRMQVTCSSDEDCELQVGSLRLALSPNEFQTLGRAVQEAVDQLDKILDAGMWDEKEPAAAPPTILEHLRRYHFSDN